MLNSSMILMMMRAVVEGKQSECQKARRVVQPSRKKSAGCSALRAANLMHMMTKNTHYSMRRPVVKQTHSLPTRMRSSTWMDCSVVPVLRNQINLNHCYKLTNTQY